MKTYYEILGISYHATHDEIKKAFRELAKQTHPDINLDDRRSQNRFQEVGEAYKVLIDKKQRAAYDLQQQKQKSSGDKAKEIDNSFCKYDSTVGFDAWFHDMAFDCDQPSMEKPSKQKDVVDSETLFEKFMGFRPK